MIRTPISDDLVANPIQTTRVAPRPRSRTAGPENPADGDTLGDLPGSSDLNWMEA